MSLVQKIIGKSKTRTKPITKNYNNPKADGTYRICMHCETMFPIFDDLSKAALCWNCALRVIKSGHYLGPHLTLPDYKHYPDFESKTVIVADEPESGNKPKLKKCSCGKKFLPKSNRQVHCENCAKKNAITAAKARVRKHRANKGSGETV